MKYGSVCSGVEAATLAWEGLGWEAQWFCEFDKFPSAVLAHHWPEVPNLHDMTEILENEVFNERTIDLLVGGTPGQSFSIAGLRKGLDDDRGNLSLKFCEILRDKKPKYFVWENVPGVFSANEGRDIVTILDAFEDCGYILDVDILDAQFHGVPQRRRRIFVCGIKADFLLKKKTNLSSLTIAQCLIEILHGILVEKLNQSGREPIDLGCQNLSRDGILRKMKLFGLHTEKNNFKKLLCNLEEAYQRFLKEPKKSASVDGLSEKELIAEDLLMALKMENLSTLTDGSWKKNLEETYEVMKLFTTSTTTNKITDQTIYTCFQAVLNIGALILHLRRSCPNSLSAGLSFLTAMEEYTDYARKASTDLFKQLDGFHDWYHLIGKARNYDKFIRYLGDWRPAASVLFEQESLRGDLAPSREKRKETTRKAVHGLGSGREQTGTILANCGEKHFLGNQEALSGDFHVVSLAHTKSNGSGITKDTTYTLEATSSSNQAICFEPRSPDGVPRISGDIAPTLNTMSGGQREPCIYKGNRIIRRLTPLECERLQGFPDNHTKIPYRNKPASECPDGPRYKACGNSMAVPVMKWIGERIQRVEDLINHTQ